MYSVMNVCEVDILLLIILIMNVYIVYKLETLQIVLNVQKVFQLYDEKKEKEKELRINVSKEDDTIVFINDGDDCERI